MNVLGVKGSVMGDIFKEVEIHGYDKHDKIVDGARLRCIVDTGASRSVISTRVAQACGAYVFSSPLAVEGKKRNVAWFAIKVDAKDCGHVLLLAIVDDSLVKRANPATKDRKKTVDMILGHDYMQNQRMVVYMDEDEEKRSVECRLSPVEPAPPLSKATKRQLKLSSAENRPQAKRRGPR